MRIKMIVPVLLIGFSFTTVYGNKKNTYIPVDERRLQRDVQYISSMSPRPYNMVKSLNKVGSYIESEMRKTSGVISIQPFSVNGETYKNIICSFGPRDGERIVVGAHYDGCGDTPGADDNASGVAGILEIARLISELKPDLKHRIDLVAYTLEEPPFYKTRNMGSYIHAESLRSAGVHVKVMISLEMIGYFTDQPDTQKFPIRFLKFLFPTTGNYIVVAGPDGELLNIFHRRMESISDLPVETFHYKIELSDHINYWEFGYPALLITDTAFYRNPNYHQKSDSPETLDYRKMAEVVKGVYWSIVNL